MARKAETRGYLIVALGLGAVALGLALAAFPRAQIEAPPRPAWAKQFVPGGLRFPYGGREFSGFVSESFRNCGGKSKEFFDWFNQAFQEARGVTLARWLNSWKVRLDTTSRSDVHEASTEAQREFAADVHKAIKQTIRKFSFDRGFEFAYTVRFGERQCLLQSVLAAGLLQKDRKSVV